MTAHRIYTSEPDQAFRQPPTAWQRDRMGRVQPMQPLEWPMESHGEVGMSDRQQLAWVGFIFLVLVPVLVGIGAWLKP